MPTITVDKAALQDALGRKFTTEEFDDLCFDFGLELDEDTTDKERPIVDGIQEPPQLKIEVAANRYDMLCFEGIALNLNVYLQRQEFPTLRLVAPVNGDIETMIVHTPTHNVRGLVSCAILRNIKFTKERYESFIALQDKLHANLARQRTLVSIGTHDLDTIKGPFHYKALPPEEIKFVPLNQTKEMNAAELMKYYEKDKHLGRYLHIIRDKPVYPVIYDSNGVVLSLPPIINGDHSKITLNTKNVFIEITATDRTKVEIVNQVLVTMFSQYCEEAYTVEPVKIISDHNSESRETPDLTPRQMVASVVYLNNCTGLKLKPSEQCKYLKKMGHVAKPGSKNDAGEDTIDVSVPVSRADILHQCDIMEDLAIAYGFKNLPKGFPSLTYAAGEELPINKLTEYFRTEAVQSGYLEVNTLFLCSHDENFAWMGRKDDGKQVVRVQNPKTREFEIVRTSLQPGLFKCIRENKAHPIPFSVFEVADVVMKDESVERRTRQERHFACATYGQTSRLEHIHGTLDRMMSLMRIPFLGVAQSAEKTGYWLEHLEEATSYVKGRALAVHLNISGKHIIIGEFGITSPEVSKNFELPYVSCSLEINLEPFL